MSPVRRPVPDDPALRGDDDAAVPLASALAWVHRPVPGAHASIEDALQAAADAYGDGAAAAP